MKWYMSFCVVYGTIIGLPVVVAVALCVIDYYQTKEYRRELMREGCRIEVQGQAECLRDMHLGGCPSRLRACEALEHDDWDMVFRKNWKN